MMSNQKDYQGQYITQAIHQHGRLS